MSHPEQGGPMAARQTLSAGAQQLGIHLSDAQMDALLAYWGLLQKWNTVYNLTALRDPHAMLTHHLLDSLAAVPPLLRQAAQLAWARDGEDDDKGVGDLRLLDVGSGGGLPGVVIAIACPHVRVDCVDTVAKKSAFVQQVAATLGLPHLRGIHQRVEKLADAPSFRPYDIVASRAFASLADFTNWSRSALAADGIWMAMKGKSPDDEVAALPDGVHVFHVEQLTVPGLDAERCIIWMRKAPPSA